MPVSISDLVRGPALVTFTPTGGSATTFFTRNGIAAPLSVVSSEDDTADLFPATAEKSDVDLKLTFQPIGEVEALAQLYPYKDLSPGDSVFGEIGGALVVHTQAGVKITFPKAAVTKEPDLILNSKSSLFGPMEFTCLRDSDDWSVADKLYKVEAAAFPGTTAYDADLVLKQCYHGAWGASAPWDSFEFKDGARVTFAPRIEPFETDCGGVIDYDFVGYDVRLTGEPLAIDEDEILDAFAVQGSGIAKGDRLTGDDLEITATAANFFFTLKAAALFEGGPAMNFGKRQHRSGQLTWRAFGADGEFPLYYIGTTAEA